MSLSFGPIASAPMSGSSPLPTYSYIASGNLSLSNAGNYKPILLHESSGNISFSNSSDVQFIPGPLIQAETGSGGCLMNESSTISVHIATPSNQAETGSGGCLMNESSTIQVYIFTPEATGSGGINLGGSANVTVSYYYQASGSLTFNNSANTSFNVAYEASGGVTFGDTANVIPTYIYQASGGVTFGETANVIPTYIYQASGNLIIGGSSDASISSISSYSYEASGGLTFNNSSNATVIIIYEASGGVTFGETANVIPTYIYQASGGVTFGETVNVIPTYIYEASGGVTFGETANVIPTYIYQASGGVTFGETANVIPTYIYQASGGVTFGETANVIPTYIYEASGGVTFSNGAIYYSGNEHQGSIELHINGNAEYSLTLPCVSDGSLSLGSSADVTVRYIYIGSGSLSFIGDFNYSTPTQNYYYEASGSIGTLTGDLSRPFDIRMLPRTGYWDLIEDSIQKHVQSRLYCDDPISQEAFLGALKNDNVRRMIDLSTEWRVICYLGNGIYDIVIDGRRMEVNSFIELTHPTPPVISSEPNIDEVNNNIINTGTPTFLSKEVVLNILKSNSRVRKMVTSSDVKDWTTELIEGLLSITIITKSDQIVKITANPQAQAVDIDIPSVSTTTNNSVTSSNVEKIVKVPKEYVMAILGPNSFLRRVPLSSWEVLKVNGKEVDVQLENGLIFSVPLR